MPAKQSTLERILELANKKGVTLIIDGSHDTESAKIGTPYTYKKNDKILTIFLVNLKARTLEGLLPLVKEKWEEEGLILKDTQEQVLESYTEYTEENKDKNTIEHFEEVLSTADLNALKMSLFMRSEKERGEKIDVYKNNIRQRFGERGTYIANLCNAGYFENELMDASKNMSPNDFDRYYELMVGKELIALFVHSGMRTNDMKEHLDEKLLQARRFAVPEFRIHGIGASNVEFITDFFNEEWEWEEAFDLELKNETQNPPSIEYLVRLRANLN